MKGNVWIEFSSEWEVLHVQIQGSIGVWCRCLWENLWKTFSGPNGSLKILESISVVVVLVCFTPAFVAKLMFRCYLFIMWKYHARSRSPSRITSVASVSLFIRSERITFRKIQNGIMAGALRAVRSVRFIDSLFLCLILVITFWFMTMLPTNNFFSRFLLPIPEIIRELLA